MTWLRAVFHEEDDARAVTALLARDGFQASVERERLAGEDDDEDHPWAVLTDAPEVVVDLLAEERDGWVDTDPHPGADGLEESGPSGSLAPPAPLALPDAPRRVKGHTRQD